MKAVHLRVAMHRPRGFLVDRTRLCAGQIPTFHATPGGIEAKFDYCTTCHGRPRKVFAGII